MKKKLLVRNVVFSVSILVVVLGLLLNIALSSYVVADGAGADGGGNAWGGVANNGGLFISTDSAAWKAPSLDDIAAGNVNGVSMNADGSITINGFNGTGGFHASGATIMCPAGTTNLYMYSLVAQRDGYGYKAGDLVGLMGMDGNSPVYNSSEFGGGTRYNANVSGALSFQSVADTYNDLYSQGLVHVGWGNGNGLSWFCSAGDGSYTPPSTSDACTRGVSAGYTTIEVKVINTRLRGTYSGWRNFSNENSNVFSGAGQVTYAMPTDEIQWAHCYYPGVQLNYGELGTTLTKTVIDGVEVRNADPSWWHDSNRTNFYDKYDGKDLYSVPSNVGHGFYTPELSTMRAEMNARFGAESSWWENKWWIDRLNVTPWSPNADWYFEYNLPQNTTSKQKRQEYSSVGRVNDVGQELVENDETGTPRMFVINRYNHDPWNVTNVKYRLYEYDHSEPSWTDGLYYEWDSCPSSYDGTAGRRSFAYTYTEEWTGNSVNVYKCSWQVENRISKFHPCRGDANCRSTEPGSWRYIDVGDVHSSPNVEGKLETAHAKSSAKVLVPYNFVNVPEIEINNEKGSDGIVYAGDTVEIQKAVVNVNPVPNPVTEATYATIVRGATIGFVAYATSDPSTFGPKDGNDLCSGVVASYIDGRRLCESVTYTTDLNKTGDLNGVAEPLSEFYNPTEINSGKPYKDFIVFDANAGDYMCYAIAVYPSGSGDPTNINPSGNRQWGYSNPACFKIAKKPYFGVYGGSIYSGATIATSNTEKSNIFGDENYDFDKIWRTGIIGMKYFGSFAEQSIYGINAITGLASGSAYLENRGISNDNYCNSLVPLTMANAGNKACNVKPEAGFMNEDVIGVDREAYIDFWMRSSLDTGETDNNTQWGEFTKYYSNTGKNIYYKYISGNYDIGAKNRNETFNVPNGTTRLIKATGDLWINANIAYSESGNKITSAGDIPQVIIYAKNIYIDCNVERIDAILIATGDGKNNPGKVSTCANIDTTGLATTKSGLSVMNSRNASHPLRINGVVITDKLYLYRTYGAAVDGYSGTPAETINYDSSSILWARYMAGASESNTMTEVYRTELAPRY